MLCGLRSYNSVSTTTVWTSLLSSLSADKPKRKQNEIRVSSLGLASPMRDLKTLSLFSFLRSELLTKTFPLGYKDQGPLASSLSLFEKHGKLVKRRKNSQRETVRKTRKLVKSRKKTWWNKIRSEKKRPVFYCRQLLTEEFFWSS